MKNFTLTFKRIMAVLILLTAIVDTALPTLAEAYAGGDPGINVNATAANITVQPPTILSSPPPLTNINLNIPQGQTFTNLTPAQTINPINNISGGSIIIPPLPPINPPPIQFTIIPVPTTPVVVNQQVLPTVNGEYGANLHSVVGAGVLPGTTRADIITPGQASYLQWNNLNTAPGQTLNYTFLNNGTSFNSVIGGGLSRFAGSLTQEGAGRIVISNPNGILFENGSMVNANAMTLTTQEIQGFNPATNTVTWGTYGNGGIQIGQGDFTNAAVMRINNDLTVVAPAGIKVDGADILAGSVKLVTTDGVNYYASNEGVTNEVQAGATLTTPQNETLNVNTNYNGVQQAILVKDSAIAVRDNTTGKIYFNANNGSTDAHITVTDSNLNGDTTILTKGDITVNNTYGTSLTAGAAEGEGTLIDYSKSVTITGGSNFDNVKAFAADINVNASDINYSANLIATNNITIENYSTINNAGIEAENLIKIDTFSTVSNSDLYANDIRIDNCSTLYNTYATAQNIYVENFSTIENSFLGANQYILVDSSTIKNDSLSMMPTIMSNGDIDIYYSDVVNANIQGNNVTIGDASIVNQSILNGMNDINIIEGSTLNSTTAFAQGNVNMTSSAANSSELYAGGNIQLNNSRISDSFAMAGLIASETGGDIIIENYSTVENSILLTSNNILIDSSYVYNDTLPGKPSIYAGNNVEIYNSDAINLNIEAKSADIGGTTLLLGSSIYTTSGDINVTDYNTNVVDSTLISGNDINLLNYSTTTGSTLSAFNDINIQTATVDDSTLYTTNNIYSDNGSIYESSATAQNIFIENYSTVENTTLSANQNILIDSSTVKNDSLPSSATIIAGGDIDIYYSDITNANISATNVSIGDASNVGQSTINANEEINIIEGTGVDGSTLTAGTDVNVIDSTLSNSSSISAGGNIYLENASLYDSYAMAGTGESGGHMFVENNSHIENSGLYASQDIYITDSNIYNDAITGKPSIYAGNNISIEGSDLTNIKLQGNTVDVTLDSTITDSRLYANSDINIDGSMIKSTILNADYNINITNSRASGVIEAFATNGDVKISNTNGVVNYNEDGGIELIDYATMNLNAGGNVLIDSSTLNNAIIGATGNSTISNSTIGETIITAGADSTILDSSLGSLTVNATNDSFITNSSYNDANITTGHDSWITKVIGGATTINATNDSNINDGSLLGDTTITTGHDSNINGSLLANTNVNAGNDSNIYSSYIDSLTVTAGNDSNITGMSVIGNTTINSGNNTNIVDSYLGNTTITADGNIAIVDSNLESGLFNAVGNINLAGIYVANDLTITGVNDLVISNSNTALPEGYPTISGLSTGLKTISDYDRTKFTDSTFETMADKLGYGAPAYGAGVRTSFIGGNLDISNANSVAIVNTSVAGNLSESNILTDTSLVYSYVGGNTLIDKASVGGDASVYKTFIKGSYERNFPDVALALNEVSKLKYGSQLDTDFKQQFTPKGFAANDDEINTMKRQTISNLVKGKNNSLKLNSAFKAY